MRVIFMGTPDFAVATLRAVVDAGHEVVLVVTRPDKPVGRGRQVQAPPVAQAARELGLDVAQPKALRSGPFPERFCALKADVAVVIAYGRVLPKRLLEAPQYGCVNVHASLLPRWRGAAPMQAAILAGDSETGVCTQQMEEGLDTGPVFVSRRVPLSESVTTGELHDTLAALGAEVAVETLAMIPGAVPRPQDTEGVTYASKISKDDGRLDWQSEAIALGRRARAMSPWPGGWALWRGKRLKVLEVRVDERSGTPGTIASVSPLRVFCGAGVLELVRVQAPGKRPVSGVDFANGARLAPGDVL